MPCCLKTKEHKRNAAPCCVATPGPTMPGVCGMALRAASCRCYCAKPLRARALLKYWILLLLRGLLCTARSARLWRLRRSLVRTARGGP